MVNNSLIKRSLIASVLVCGMASFASMAPANAAVIAEAEAVGTATSNTLATAESIPGATFTAPEPATVFPRPGSVTATVLGHGGGEDVDFYSFLLGGSDPFAVLFDIDDDPFSFDTILSLFDSTGTLIAFNDDSFPEDLGTESGLDSFLGTINLYPGTYYVAVSAFPNFPTAAFTATLFSLNPCS